MAAMAIQRGAGDVALDRFARNDGGGPGPYNQRPGGIEAGKKGL